MAFFCSRRLRMLLLSHLVVCSCLVTPITSLPRGRSWPSDQCVHEGATYSVGDDVPTVNPCNTCFVDHVMPASVDALPVNDVLREIDQGEPQCMVLCLLESCPIWIEGIPCANAIKAEGQCCEECPTGPNCEYQGALVEVGTRVWDDESGRCEECVGAWWSPVTYDHESCLE